MNDSKAERAIRDAVVKAMDEILAAGAVVTPVDVFIRSGRLTRKDYEEWRFGRIPHLERAINGGPAKVNRILRRLDAEAKGRGLKPSNTVYCRWGKGPKTRLRFSRFGDPGVEAAFSCHYVDLKRIEAQRNATAVPGESAAE